MPSRRVIAAGRRRRLLAPTREAAEALWAEKIKDSRQAAPPSEDPDITIGTYAERWLAFYAHWLPRGDKRFSDRSLPPGWRWPH